MMVYCYWPLQRGAKPNLVFLYLWSLSKCLSCLHLSTRSNSSITNYISFFPSTNFHTFNRTESDLISVLLMEEILHQLIGSLSHHFQGFIHPRWLFRISSIIPTIPRIFRVPTKCQRERQSIRWIHMNPTGRRPSRCGSVTSPFEADQSACKAPCWEATATFVSHKKPSFFSWICFFFSRVIFSYSNICLYQRII